ETAGPGLTLRPAPGPDSSADGSSLMFYGTAASYSGLKERKLALVQPNGMVLETVATILQSEPTFGDLTFRRIYLAPPLKDGFSLASFPLENPIVTVYGNLIEATQGKTETMAVLGNGDARQTFQTFNLPKSPLTYL